METQYTILPAKQLIVVDAEGRLDREASKAAIRRLASDPGYSEQYRIIVDVRDAECAMSMFDIAELAAYMAWPDPALPTRKRIAVVATKDGLPDLVSFLETCARNRGLRVRAFESMESAEAWIRSEAA